MPDSTLDVSLDHFGFDRMDVSAWYEDVEANGVPVDNRTGTFDGPLQLLPGFFVIYIQGPSGERIEIESGEDEELAHVHLMTPDVDGAVPFFEALLGVDAANEQAQEALLPGEFDGMPIEWTSNTFTIDKVDMILFGPPFSQARERYDEPSDSRPVDHVAFSFEDLDPVLQRIEDLEVEVVRGPELDEAHGFRSVFVRGPNLTLIELVEAPPP